mgnify:CR=1 FL=1
MKSMTGFGKGLAERSGIKITVDVKTVNHKVLDLSIKSPRALFFAEDAIREIVKKYVKRGHTDVFVGYRDARDERGKVSVDLPLAKQYLSAAKELESIGVTNDVTASQILRMPEVVTVEPEEANEDELIFLAKSATEEACLNLVQAREKEGAALKKELRFRLENLEKIVEEIALRAPLVAENYAAKLRQRMEEVLSGVEIDQSRFLTEVACFTDKCNVDEEITRLRAHLKHGFSLMDEKNEVGKKLDFLVQEINREINTTGSKSNDIMLTQKVLAAKNELEKFREQVQNIE